MIILWSLGLSRPIWKNENRSWYTSDQGNGDDFTITKDSWSMSRANLSVTVCIVHVDEEVARKEVEYMPTAHAVHDVELAEDHVPALQVRQDDDCKYWPAGQLLRQVPYDVQKLAGHPAGQ